MTLTDEAMQREPAVLVGSLTSLLSAAMGLVVAFGLPLTAAQQTAILGLMAVYGPIVVGRIVRSKVYSPATVRKLVAKALSGGAET